MRERRPSRAPSESSPCSVIRRGAQAFSKVPRTTWENGERVDKVKKGKQSSTSSGSSDYIISYKML